MARTRQNEVAEGGTTDLGFSMVAGVTPISISREVEAAVLALNNAHAVELSWLEDEQLRTLLSQAFMPGGSAAWMRFSSSSLRTRVDAVWHAGFTPISSTWHAARVMSSSCAR